MTTTMKKLTVLSTLIIISALVFLTNTTQAEYVAGDDYVILDKFVKTETGDQIEVRELFWYFCHHCYDIEHKVNKWLQTMDSSAQFVRQPAVWSPSLELGANFYYVLQQLGEFERLHSLLFDAIHRQKLRFSNQQDFVTWLALVGVEEEKANAAYESFSVQVNLNKAKANTFKYRIQGVPSFIVNGKYLVDSNHAGSHERIFEVVDYLIKKESQ